MNMKGRKKIIVHVTIPRIIQDNPMCSLSSRDGKFHERMPVTGTIIKWLKGENEGYFELWMTDSHIISMKPVTEKEYLETKGPAPEQLAFEGLK
jgi:hypothetical protein